MQGQKRFKNRSTKTKRSHNNRGGINAPPRVLGSQQIQTQLKVKEKQDRRTIRVVYDIASSASGTVAFNICTNVVSVHSNLGGATLVAAADTSIYANYELFKIKAVEVIWSPTIPTSTAVPAMYAIYDPVLTDSDFGSVALGTLLNYGNAIRFDPRQGTSFLFSIKNPSMASGPGAILNGGWIPTTFIGTGANSAFTTSGVIPVQGSGLGISVALGRLEIVWLVIAKGNK